MPGCSAGALGRLSAGEGLGEHSHGVERRFFPLLSYRQAPLFCAFESGAAKKPRDGSRGHSLGHKTRAILEKKGADPEAEKNSFGTYRGLGIIMYSNQREDKGLHFKELRLKFISKGEFPNHHRIQPHANEMDVSARLEGRDRGQGLQQVTSAGTLSQTLLFVKSYLK